MGLVFNDIFYEASYGTATQLPKSDLIEIVFAGRSNVGKSSLLNKLFNRKNLARVSSMPGKTITVNFFRQGDIRFVDLPGYGYAKRSGSEKKRWAELMEEFFKSGRNIRLVVQLLDMRHPPSSDDMDMLSFLIEVGFPFVIVLTKSDKLNKTQKQNRRESLIDELHFIDDAKFIEFSALNGEGIKKIKEVILDVINQNK